MPLTPASCASDLAGDASKHIIAMLTRIVRLVNHRRAEIETDGARLMAQ